MIRNSETPFLLSSSEATPCSRETLREQIYRHLRETEERLFENFNASLESGGVPNASLAQALRQYIHDVLGLLDELEECEKEPLEITLAQIQRAYEEMKRQEG